MEISGHSMSMGYILSQALNKQTGGGVIQKRNGTDICKGDYQPKIGKAEYNQQNLEKVIDGR